MNTTLGGASDESARLAALVEQNAVDGKGEPVWRPTSK
jgi:hypothetical protein